MFNEKNDVAIGKVLSPHGIGGLVKVYPLSDHPDRLSRLSTIDLLRGSDRQSMIIEKATTYGRFWLVKFKGIDTRDDGRLLEGSVLVIPRHERFPLPDGSFYHDQLISLQVYSRDGELIGLIIDIISTGGHDLLMIERSAEEKKKTMIPLVREFVKEVDLQLQRVVVDLPDGLLDL